MSCPTEYELVAVIIKLNPDPLRSSRDIVSCYVSELCNDLQRASILRPFQNDGGPSCLFLDLSEGRILGRNR